MKVLLTTDTFYPMINGVVISTVNLYNELKKQGHDVRILTLSQSGQDKVEGDFYYMKSLKVRVYPDAKIKHFLISELPKRIIEWKPDIVHSQTEFSTMIVARSIAKKTKAPQIHTYHTMYEEYLNYILRGKIIRPGMVAKITKVLFDRMDAVVVPTRKMRYTLEKYKVKVPIYIVPTGLDIKKFQKPLPQEEKDALISRYDIEGKKLLVYVGRIAEEKNINEVISFFSSVSGELEDLRLMIVGGGPYLAKLEALARELGVEDKVIFTGMVSPNEVHKYYRLGDVFTTSSTSETQGLTYIEALASGLPVLCRYDPCIEGLIINGETGYSYNNEEEFRIYAKKLIMDDDHRKIIAYTAKQKAKEYSKEIFGEKISRIYSTVIRNR